MAKDLTVSGKELVPYVLVIDTERVYLYNGLRMQAVFELDELRCLEDVATLRELLRTLIPQSE